MRKSKRVWFIANINQNSNGGIARSIATLSSYLEKKNYKVTHFFSKANNSNYLWFSFKVLFIYIQSLFKNKPDCIIARSTDAFFILLFNKLLRVNTNIIIYNHGWEPLVFNIEKKVSRDLIDNPTTIKAHLLRFPMLYISMVLSDYTVSGTIHETRYLKKKYHRYSNKFKYIPNPIYINQNLTDLTDKKRVFLTVSNVNWKKNLDYSIKLFKLLNENFTNIKLICAGTHLSQSEFIQRYGINDNIQNLTSLKPEEMNKIYQKAEYFLSSSRYEGGHSFAILEAMNNNVLAIASSIPSSKEIIENGENGFLISGTDLNSDKNLIKKILSNDNTLIKQNAYKAIHKFSIERIGPKLEILLEKKCLKLQ